MDVFPGFRWLIARQVWDDLKRTTMATFFKWLPPQAYAFGGKRADSDKLLRLNNGSEILWMHMDDPERENVIKGLEINGFGLDQAEDIDETIYDDLSSRLNRWDGASVSQRILDWYRQAHGRDWPWQYEGSNRYCPPPYSVITVNPDHTLHWVYRRFHPDSPELDEPREGGSWRQRGYKMLNFPSDDNKFLSRRTIQVLAGRDESFQRRFRRGEWGITEGQIHVVNDYNLLEGSAELLEWIRQTCTLHRILDHGDSSPTCCAWMAVDQAGNIIFYREYYQPNRLISFHRQRIFELSIQVPDVHDPKLEKYSFNIADPSIFLKAAQRKSEKFSVSDEYEDYVNQPKRTAVFWMKGDNDELGTRNRIGEYLQLDPDHVHPISKGRGSPRLFFIKRTSAYPHGCFNLIRETQAQKRVRIGTDAGRPVFSDERDDSVPDHGYDCVRYGVASRPPLAYAPEKQPGEFSWKRQHQLLQDYYKRRGYRLDAARAREYGRRR